MKIKKTSLAASLLSVFTLAAIRLTAEVAYDVALDFSTNSNPNGVWTYGYTPSLGTSLNLYREFGNSSGLLYRVHNISSGTPSVIFNSTTNTLTLGTPVIGPGEAAFHPGPNNEYSAIRFTAPVSGSYRLESAFFGIDNSGTSTDVHVLLNNVLIFNGLVNGFGPGSGPIFNTNIVLNTGDRVDFAVGYGSNGFLNDTTGIRAKFVRAGTEVQSTFDDGGDGWTQMDLDADVRYLLPIEEVGEPGCDLIPPGNGILSFIDPDAGEWVFDAPAKFKGDKSALYGGSIRWRQHYRGCSVGDPPAPTFRLILVSTNQAIVMTMPPPPYDEWISYSIPVQEEVGWAWCDDATGQEELPPASAEQIQEVLRSVTGFRIVGEFITGDDIGSLDDVTFSFVAEPQPPTLSVTRASTNVIVSWPLANSGWRLQTATNLTAPLIWTDIPPPYGTNDTNCILSEPVQSERRFYRLKKE